MVVNYEHSLAKPAYINEKETKEKKLVRMNIPYIITWNENDYTTLSLILILKIREIYTTGK